MSSPQPDRAGLGIVRRLMLIGVIGMLALASLLVGMLAPGVLETGQLSPLQWRACGVVFSAVTVIILSRRWSPETAMIASTLIIAFPPIVLCHAGAQTLIVMDGLRLLGACAAGAVLGIAIKDLLARKRQAAGAIVAALFILIAVFWKPHPTTGGIRPVVAVLSGPILARAGDEEQHEAHGNPKDVDGLISTSGLVDGPLVRALSTALSVRLIDNFSANALSGAEALLIIQPRALAPDELVAIDQAIRGGQRVVILADPNLLWEDIRALGDPLRPPRSSALTPLLSRWGLQLENGLSVVGRHVTEEGYLIQSAAAGRWRSDAGACKITVDGLIARCSVGRGTAILVADADVANDGLWTLAPESPLDDNQYVSDLVPALHGWLGGPARPPIAFLTSPADLPRALRMGLICLVILLIGLGILDKRGVVSPP